MFIFMFENVSDLGIHAENKLIKRCQNVVIPFSAQQIEERGTLYPEGAYN